MNGKINLDSSFLVKLMRGDESVWHLVSQYRERATTCIALAELLTGAKKSNRPQTNLAAVYQVASTLSVFYIDEKTLEHYSDISAQLMRDGTPIPTNDIWIAALSMQHDLPLVTRDGHFQYVTGLKLLSF